MRDSLNQNFFKSSNDSRKSSSDDLALWRSIKNGNDLAFSSLYNRYAQQLFNYGMHLCHNRELCKDSIQELFTYLWNRKESLSEIDSVKYYLLKSFRNLLIKSIEKDRKFFVDLDDKHEQFQPETFVEEEIILKEINFLKREKMNFALSNIPKRQREIIVLRYFNEMNYQEISSLMGISVPSAHNLLSKSLQSMLAIIGKSK
ncbi:RNA polymerase sigma factor [Algoriphagus pacificus]|uniref:Sigma-70 family RNA polymerase sigma factor n=1 Tax=Algoriphagus pacificus TaxID=2811234 RepID=A0ABS3CED2_9BACT|nr:sigma-70 family RNA polymerase sigma factor [Algoriphagus pacificus]MBN7815464.1 sigma-70 family RNA polymerase sigma factor [Algoriphagus pacificus]